MFTPEQRAWMIGKLSAAIEELVEELPGMRVEECLPELLDLFSQALFSVCPDQEAAVGAIVNMFQNDAQAQRTLGKLGYRKDDEK